MPVVKYKVFAYITHGNRLLIFRHPRSPTAGLQVPAGTIKVGEAPEAAVLREAFEETGLAGLKLNHCLGEQMWDMAPSGRNEIHHRRFYHLQYMGTPPVVWQHIETDPSEGTGSHLFEFFWGRLPDQVPPLIAEHDKFLPELCEQLTEIEKI